MRAPSPLLFIFTFLPMFFFPFASLQLAGGGAPGPDPLRRLPPPPPCRVLAPNCRTMGAEGDHGRRRRPKEILLDLVEGEKLGFCPMCLYSKYSVFLGEPNSG